MANRSIFFLIFLIYYLIVVKTLLNGWLSFIISINLIVYKLIFEICKLKFKFKIYFFRFKS